MVTSFHLIYLALSPSYHFKHSKLLMHACSIISVHFSEIVPLSPPGFILSLPLRAHECEDSYVSCNIQPEHSISKAGYKCTPFNWLKHSRRTMVRPKMATRHVTTFRLNLQSDFIIFSYPRSIPYYELTYKFGEVWKLLEKC